MLSSASLLLIDQEISQSEFDSLLEQLPGILSTLASARTISSGMFDSLNSFKLEKQNKDALDHEDQLIFTQLVQTGKDFNAEAE